MKKNAPKESMDKKKVVQVKISAPAGRAQPGPPIGPALGPKGVNAKMFCDQFNERSLKMPGVASGDVVRAVISVMADRSFTFVLKASPVSFLIKKAARVEKGAAKVGIEYVGSISKAQAIEIAKLKMSEMQNVHSIDSALRCVEGSAASMGIKVVNTDKD